MATLFVGFVLTLGTADASGSSVFFIEGGRKESYYYIALAVGSHKQRQTVIVDTGSDTFAFPCDRCDDTNCGTHADPRFSASTSTTFLPLVQCAKSFFTPEKYCGFSRNYLEGSEISGFLGTDYVELKSQHRARRTQLSDVPALYVTDLRIKTEFGCTTKETGLFTTQYADGIIGLDNQSNFIRSVEASHPGKTFSFGFCFFEDGGIMLTDLRSSPDHSATFLGKRFAEVPKKLEVPYVLNRGWFELEVASIAIAQRKQKPAKIRMLVDTGSTYTVLPNELFDYIVDEINEYCDDNPNQCGGGGFKVAKDACMYLSKDDLNYGNMAKVLGSFPDVYLHFPDHPNPLILTANQYFILSADRNEACFTLVPEKNNERITWGAFSMIDKLVYLDRVSGKLVIITENCHQLHQEFNQRRRGLMMVQPDEPVASQAEPVLPAKQVDLSQEPSSRSIFTGGFNALAWCEIALLVVSVPLVFLWGFRSSIAGPTDAKAS